VQQRRELEALQYLKLRRVLRGLSRCAFASGNAAAKHTGCSPGRCLSWADPDWRATLRSYPSFDMGAQVSVLALNVSWEQEWTQ